MKRDLSISAPFTAHTSQLPSLPMEIQYVAYLARRIKHSSIKGYLAAVRHLHIRSSYELDLKKIFRLQLICRGIKQSQGDTSRIRLPITITHLKLFFQLLAIPNTTSYDSIMLWAVMTLFPTFVFVCFCFSWVRSIKKHQIAKGQLSDR